ncbi:MAG: hypothetical protein HGB19_12330 [Chlorobiales bacterium]|nr:hypothetical protein [Chlorobiales bacterium]
MELEINQKKAYAKQKASNRPRNSQKRVMQYDTEKWKQDKLQPNHPETESGEPHKNCDDRLQTDSTHILESLPGNFFMKREKAGS